MSLHLHSEDDRASAQPICQGEQQEQERVSALKVVASELATSGVQTMPWLEGQQVVPVTPQLHVTVPQD